MNSTFRADLSGRLCDVFWDYDKLQPNYNTRADFHTQFWHTGTRIFVVDDVRLHLKWQLMDHEEQTQVR